MQVLSKDSFLETVLQYIWTTIQAFGAIRI